MKIRVLLALTSRFAAALILAMAAVLAYVSSLIGGANEGLALANDIRTTVFERIVLRDEYFNRREDRPKAQWTARTALLISQLDRATALFPKDIDAETLMEMREDTEKTITLFGKIAKNAIGADASSDEANSSSEYEKKLYSQILISSYFLRDSASRLIERRTKEIASLDGMANSLLVGSLALIALLLFLNGVWISRVLSRGLKLLASGTAKIAGGDLASRFVIASDDEIADLMRAINRMAEEMTGNFTTIRNLEEESQKRKRAEEAVKKALEENKILLRELQHRAKNSFSMILAMINMSSMSSGNPDIKNALDDLGLRVGAISEFYSLLYSTGSPGSLRLDEYCARIAAPLVALSKNIALRIEMDNIMMPSNGIVPFGLILTELVTNALKYAFPGNRPGTITIALKKGSAAAFLEVRDDGIGLNGGFDLEKSGGMGLSLVRGLSSQLNGDFRIESGAAGTICIVEFVI